jgi:hypothetical protein
MFRLFTLTGHLREQGILVGMPARLIVHMWAALLLLTIALQAAAPIGPPDHSPGSAFTAATHEVALSPRQEVQAAAAIAPLPLIPEGATLRTLVKSVVEDPAASFRNLDAPARSILTLRPGPRAPPSA